MTLSDEEKEFQKYRDAIRRRVCEHCIDFSDKKQCTLTGEEQCGVELYLKDIVRVVQSVQSERIDEYVTALRASVCHQCKSQKSDGTCQLRSVSDCGLDRYFELVVEAIEEVDKKDRH